jgi:hypothetical protein
MLRDWRALLAREIVVTVLTEVTARQHLGLALAAVVADLAAVIQTLQVTSTKSTSSIDDTRGRT